MDSRSVSNIIQLGGTILGTSRSQRFMAPEGRAEAHAQMKDRRVGALVVIGGNGSYRGAHELHLETGIPVVGVPGTIDNDVGGTDFTIGFDTAVNTAIEAIDRIRDTAFSHDRTFFVEVMGRHSGAIAIASALAGGAEEVLVPERPNELGRLCASIRGALDRGKRSIIVVVAEGDELGGAQKVADMVAADLDIRIRVTVLGHIQRGGRPTAADRIRASGLGAAAVEALLRGESDVMTCVRGGRVVTAPLEVGWKETDTLNEELARLCLILGR
jgi:6-phosphofructokinase 1